ncbi:hypothetical protein ACFQ6N_17345 [Kitasatospora sp. NPDC056446]|uniref:hypothetical protein n=1 Tax=Kitasatospora sp. NPDC056446 TaxID=3345819 RepID=UPI0036B2BEFB
MSVHGGTPGQGRPRPRARLRSRMVTGVLAAVGLLAAAGPGVVPAPARADGAGGLVLTVPSTLAVTSGVNIRTLLPVEVSRSGGALKQARITVDTKGTGVTVTAPGSGRELPLSGFSDGTFPLGDGDGAITRALALTSPLQSGLSGTIHVTAVADGLAPVTKDVVLTAADSSPALRLTPLAPVAAVPGSTVTPRPAFENSGTAPARKVVLTFTTMDGLAPAETYSNCEYAAFPDDTSASGERPDAMHAICTFERTVRTGEAYTVDPLPLEVTAAVDSSRAAFTVGAEEGPEAVNWRSLHAFRQGTGRPLGLTRIDGLPQPGLGAVKTYQVAGGQADVTMEASWKPTSPDGLTGDLTVTYRNLGPVPFVDDPSGPAQQYGDFIWVPGGTGEKAIEVPDNCVTHSGTEMYSGRIGALCTTPRSIDAGEEFSLTFHLTVAEDERVKKATFLQYGIDLGPEPAAFGPVPLHPRQQTAPQPPALPEAPPAAPAAAAPPAAPVAAPAAHHVRLRWKAAGFLAVLGVVGALMLTARRHRRSRQHR